MPAFSKEEVKAYLPNLRCVYYAAGTVKFFAQGFLEAGVKVFSAWGANAIPVAEYTLAQILLANKGFYLTSNAYKCGNYSLSRKILENYTGNYKNNIGIIGAGMIGKKVIKLLKNFDLNVFVFDPFLPNETANELGVKKCNLEKIFSECHIISNHLADKPETRGILNGKLFSLMPPYSTFINTGRGAQVVESELISILEKRLDIVAILDVTEPEPCLSGNKFYSLNNVVLSPHIAGSQGNEVHRMAKYMVEEYSRFSKGDKPLYEVSLEMLKTMA